MNIWVFSITVFCGITIAQSLFLGMFLLIRERKQSRTTVFLSLMLLGLAFRIAKSYFFYTFDDVPAWGVALGAAGLWTIGPSFLLYTLSARPRKITKWEYLHFLPPVAILLISGALGINYLVGAYYLGTYCLVCYLAICVWLFLFYPWNGNKKRFRLFAASLGLIAVTFLIQSLIGGIQLYAIGAAFTCLVLYGINFLILQDQSFIRPRKGNGKRIGKEQQKNIVGELKKAFEEKKFYRQKGITLSEVARLTGYPAYLISKTINENYGMKFNEFVNKYRVEEVKVRLQDRERNDKLEVIATEVGFTSTSSFYNAFKKETNLTPQAFRKRHLLSRQT